jgi:hypothetical protein
MEDRELARDIVRLGEAADTDEYPRKLSGLLHPEREGPDRV